jgi:exopolysaccharide biosynthesis predicted pyruvyltransferase EpsI
VLNDTDFLCQGTGEGHTSAHANFEDNPPTTAGLRRERVFQDLRDYAIHVMMNEWGGGLISSLASSSFDERQRWQSGDYLAWNLGHQTEEGEMQVVSSHRIIRIQRIHGKILPPRLQVPR